MGAMKALLALSLLAAAASTHAADPAKVFRYAFEIAESTFDPPRVSDLYSNIVNGAMFDTPLHYAYRLRPGATLPENNPKNPRYATMIKVWKRLPLPVANILGPFLTRGLG